jgi:hypothetical protein
MAEAFTDRSTRIPEPLAFEERYEVVGLERSTPTIVELWLRPLGECWSRRRCRPIRARLFFTHLACENINAVIVSFSQIRCEK